MPTRSHTAMMLVLPMFLFTACSGDATTVGDSAWAGTTDTHGDTTVVTTTLGAVHGTRIIDSIEVVYRGESLVRPSMLSLVGPTTLAVADRHQVHLLGTGGELLGTRGRDGEGPGEFRQIGAIGGRGDTLVVLDRQSRAFAIFAPGGEILQSGRLSLAGELANLPPGRIGFGGSLLTIGWTSRVSFGGEANFGGIAEHSLVADSAREVARVIGQPYIFNEEALSAARAEVYGPMPLSAVGRDGRHALTDGVEYCVMIGQPSGASPMTICREWQRISVPQSIRKPDYEAIAAASDQDIAFFGSFRLLIPGMALGESRNSIEAIRFDGAGRLWVQVVDSLTSDVHPLIDRFAGSLRASQVHWDLFDADGRLGWQLVLPATFTPWDASGTEVYGFYELPSGEVAVGRFTLE